MKLIVERKLWPSAMRKLERVADHRREAERLLRMGDRDAAQQQIRAMLTTAARGLLLAAGVFPLARSELPRQLERIGHAALAGQLDDVIRDAPDLRLLAGALKLLDKALTATTVPSAA